MTAPAVSAWDERKQDAGPRTHDTPFPTYAIPPSSVLLGLALLVGFTLRVAGTADLHLWGDAAYSVYAAQRDLLTITTERLTDGHPPLSYYVLKAWMAVVGTSEFAVRFSSALPGVLTIALTYRLGRLTIGSSSGVAGAWLVALNPYLVYYARMPRMYEWLACLGVLALVLGIRLARRPSFGRAIPFTAVVTAAAYTHYFGVLVPIALGPALLPLAGKRWKLLGWWFGASAAAALLFLPWVLFAFTSSRDTTGGIISNAPWPSSTAGLLEQLWLVAWSGELVPEDRARLLVIGATSLVAAFGLIAGLVAWRRGVVTAKWPAGAIALAVFVALPVVLSIPVFQQYPYFVRARFLIFLIPPLALLVGGLLAGHWRVSRPLGVTTVALVLVATAGALRETYRLETSIVEVESIGVTQHLAEHARPTDAALFHAFWEQGYVSAHLHERAPVMYPLRETSVQQLSALLERHGRLWLVMYQVEPRHPKYPAEEWLDRNAYRARSHWYGTARISLYTLPEERPEPVDANFGNEIALPEAWVTARRVQPGDLLGVGLRWQALTRPATNYTTFVHLLDARGRNRTGEDAEPMWGLTHTVEWTPGTVMIQRQGIPVPPDTPPGDYLVEVGLYRQDNGHRLPVLGSPPTDRVLLGSVRVEPAPSLPPVAHASRAEMSAGGGRIRVVGFTRPGDRWHPGEPVTVETITGPMVLTPRADAYGSDQTARLTVVWQVVEPIGAPLYSHLRLLPEGGGSPVAAAPAAPGLRVPVSEWPVAAGVPEDFRTVLLPAAVRGRYRLEAGFAAEGATPADWMDVGGLDADR